MRNIICLTALIFCSNTFAEMTIQSGDYQTNLIELYTSEGCSSCPPADRWLSTLKDDPALWEQLVPIAFHVDYWNHLGWKDHFSQAKFSQRQRQYAHEKAVTTVYTPGLLSNGAEWRNFSWKPPESVERRKVGPLIVTIDEDELAITFRPTQPFSSNKLVANIALLGFDLTTNVRRGENSGRELQHDFVVLELEQSKLTLQDGEYHATAPLPETRVEAGKYAIALWVSTKNEQAPLQAVGGWLNPVYSSY